MEAAYSWLTRLDAGLDGSVTTTVNGEHDQGRPTPGDSRLVDNGLVVDGCHAVVV